MARPGAFLLLVLQLVVTDAASKGWVRGFSSGRAMWNTRPRRSTWGKGTELLLVIADSVARPSDVAWATVSSFSITFELDRGCKAWGYPDWTGAVDGLSSGATCRGEQTFYKEGPDSGKDGAFTVTKCISIDCTGETDGTKVKKVIVTPLGMSGL